MSLLHRACRAVVLLLLLCACPAAAHLEQTFACFVYIEPYEVRVEFVSTPTSLRIPLTYGFDGIDPAEQQALVKEAGLKMTGVFEVRADGELLSFEPEHVGFVMSDEADSVVVPDQRELIPFYEARVSGIFVCKRKDLPRNIDVRLLIFEGRTYRPPSRIPVQIEVLTWPAGRSSARFEFTRESPQQSWALPASAVNLELASTAPPPPHAYTPLYLAGALLLVGLSLCVLPMGRRSLRIRLGMVVMLFASSVAAISFWRGLATPIDEAQARATLQALLTNVYYAFAYREESKIFDTLATSVDGPLLQELYLDIQRGISEAEDGGPSVRVLSVELLDCEIDQSNSQALRAKVRWVSRGTVSHWGHAHDRQNQYRAQVVAQPVDGRWRLTSVNILEQERIN